MESEDIDKNVRKATKKRPSFGRLTDVAKRLRLQSNVTGDDCKCKRLNCFTNVTEDERRNIIKHYNELPTYDDQISHLTGLITVLPVARRRSRQPDAHFHEATYSYKVRVMRAGKLEDVPICRQAFISIHGITKGRIYRIVTSLKLDGQAPTDGRGKHKNRPHKLTKAKEAAVKDHIASFQLSEELNVKKMHRMYMEKNVDLPVSYESYRSIFVKHSNSNNHGTRIDETDMNETESRDGFDPGICMQVVKSEPLDLSSDVEESSTEFGVKEESYDIKLEVESDEEDGEHVLPEPTTKRTSYGKPIRTLTEPVPEKQPDAICPGPNSEPSHGIKCTCAIQNEDEKNLQRAKLRLILSTIEKMEFDLKRSQERSKQEDELFQLDKMKKEIEVDLCRLQVIKMKRDLEF